MSRKNYPLGQKGKTQAKQAGDKGFLHRDGVERRWCMRVSKDTAHRRFDRIFVGIKRPNLAGRHRIWQIGRMAMRQSGARAGNIKLIDRIFLVLIFEDLEHIFLGAPAMSFDLFFDFGWISVF